MHGQKRRAVALLDRPPERMLVADRAAVGVTVQRAARLKGCSAQALLQAQAAQHAHGVGALLQACPQPRERARLLVDHRLNAEALQRGGGSQATDAGAQDDERMVFHRG